MKLAAQYVLMLGVFIAFYCALLGFDPRHCALVMATLLACIGAIGSIPTHDRRTVYDIIRKYERFDR